MPLPADGPERLALSPEDKPICLSPSKIPEPPQDSPEEEPLAEREVKAEVEDLEEVPTELPPLGSPLALPVPEAMVAVSPGGGCGGGLLEAQALSTAAQGCREPSEASDFGQVAEPQVELPSRTEPHMAALELGTQLTPEPLVETKEEPVEVPLDMPREGPVAEAGLEDSMPQPTLTEPQPNLELSDCDLPVPEGQCLNLEAQEATAAPSSACYLEETHSELFLPGLEDPLAGMNVLAAAAELPQARPLPSLGTGVPGGEKQDAAPTAVLEHGFLQGITLLSEIAELELDRRGQEAAGKTMVHAFSEGWRSQWQQCAPFPPVFLTCDLPGPGPRVWTWRPRSISGSRPARCTQQSPGQPGATE